MFYVSIIQFNIFTRKLHVATLHKINVCDVVMNPKKVKTLETGNGHSIAWLNHILAMISYTQIDTCIIYE